MNAPPQFGNSVLPILASVHFGYWLLWAGSLGLTIALIVLLRTRWGHSRPLQKCAVLSLIVHLFLAFVTMTVRIVNGDGMGGGAGGNGSPIHVHIVEEAAKPVTKSIVSASQHTVEVTAPALLAPPPKPDPPAPVAQAEKAAPKPKVDETTSKDSIKMIVEPKVAKTDIPIAPKPVAAQPASPMAVTTTKPAAPSTAAAAIEPTPTNDIAPPAATPVATNTYALRTAPGRLGLIAGQGGNAQTEAAVTAALRWLAAAQSRDGRWDTVQFGGGQEQMVLGQNRGGAGRGADTGITALALLAFLGAGNSHVQGPYQDNVRRGLDFLLRSQAADGSLFGDASLYAQMYCHSMATFALAESQAVTSDRRLMDAVTKAVNFSISAQNTSTGGWRYRPGDTGDTSQLGWQIMALTSAQRAGIDIPDQTWTRVDRFLQTVRRGNTGGLASYRPDSPASTSMTAEALYCRLVLAPLSGSVPADAAADEATAQLLASPPSIDQMNLYYWYYATLALHHRQNANPGATKAWRTWNDAMTTTLTKTQVATGDDAGSWETSTLWGGYGGRVYTTSMAAMCLEVYYRYTPAPASVPQWTANRPQSLSR